MVNIYSKKYSKHFELSISSGPEEPKIIYEVDNVRHLYGNDDYAVWSEIGNNKVKYLYYDGGKNLI